MFIKNKNYQFVHRVYLNFYNEKYTLSKSRESFILLITCFYCLFSLTFYQLQPTDAIPNLNNLSLGYIIIFILFNNLFESHL
jgi:hypothetical protein